MNAFKTYPSWHRTLNIVATAFVFIATGLLFMGHNLGLIDSTLFHTLVSWQMLLIVIGVVMLIKRHFLSGLILITVGTYFLLPSTIAIGAYWPVLLILIGIGILLKLFNKSGKGPQMCKHSAKTYENSMINDGFIASEVTFGEAKHIVLDPVFKGADLNVTFGSITLDLRRTLLESEETFINLNMNFSGVELYIPSNWNVIFEAKTSLGGVDDKRFMAHDIDHAHKLIIRGNITFSGVEIKN